MVSDPGSLQYILNNPHFEYGPALEKAVQMLHRKESVVAAKGLLSYTPLYMQPGSDFVTGDYRKKVRAALNSGFTAAAVRNYRPVFEKAAQAARLIFLDNCESTCLQLVQQLEENTGMSINICPLLSFATLSTISEGRLCKRRDNSL
jgi:hypothetical protein